MSEIPPGRSHPSFVVELNPAAQASPAFTSPNDAQYLSGVPEDCSIDGPHWKTAPQPPNPPSWIPAQKWAGSSLRKSPSSGVRKPGTVAFIQFMHWYTSLLEGADACCALRLGEAPELAKAKERVRTVTEPNFVVASDMRNYAPSDSGRTDENSAEIAHVDGKGSISGRCGRCGTDEINPK
jgi:hypothetical protein